MRRPLLLPHLSGLRPRPFHTRSTSTIEDFLTPTPSRLFDLTLHDLWPAHPRPTTAPRTLQPGYHLLHFPLPLPPSALLADGTDPAHLPDPSAPPPRRLWAGGEIAFLPGWAGALRLDGRAAVCRETVGVPRGEAGRPVYVDVWREYGAGTHGAAGPVVIRERRTLAFLPEMGAAKEAVGAGCAAPVQVAGSVASVQLTPGRIHLFNFSALSYNAHTIHLDAERARVDEGLRGLLVHGPFTVMVMLSFARTQLREGAERVARIEYRNLAPLYCGETMTVCANRKSSNLLSVWILGQDGRFAVRAKVLTSDQDIE